MTLSWLDKIYGIDQGDGMAEVAEVIGVIGFAREVRMTSREIQYHQPGHLLEST